MSLQAGKIYRPAIQSSGSVQYCRVRLSVSQDRAVQGYDVEVPGNIGKHIKRPLQAKVVVAPFISIGP
jgi:hypothetical protein